MNNEHNQEQPQISVGQLLKQAREKLELSQQTVADRLCLKLTTVREIEDDNVKEQGSTFVRGYIRSYAKLLHISEPQILVMLDKQVPIKSIKVQPMKSVALGKQRKKREGWLMKFTWLIVLVVIAMIGLWWWQQYKAQQADLVSMAVQNEALTSQTSEQDINNQSGEHSQDGDAGLMQTQQAIVPHDPSTSSTASAQLNAAATLGDVEIPVDQNTIVPLPGSDRVPPAIDRTLDNASTQTADTQSVISKDGLVLTFKSDCWLEVVDNKGKKIFSGTKRSGDVLEFAGAEPYRLKIGAPAAVDVLFKGQAIDMSKFIAKKSVANFTVPSQG